MTSDMAQTTKSQNDAAGTAKPQDKDLMARLADVGEDALQRIADLPGGQRALSAVNELRTRVDDLAKKVRGIDALEARVAKLEKEVAALKKPKSASRSTTSSEQPKSEE